ncbi:unnamed protein product [Ixodes persulcatus]
MLHFPPLRARGGGKRVLQCPHCPFQSSFQSSIRRHQLRHTKERPHVCSVCDQSFQRRYQLTQHLVSQHTSGDKTQANHRRPSFRF